MNRGVASPIAKNIPGDELDSRLPDNTMRRAWWNQPLAEQGILRIYP
ncbi:MAG: hypothetical protein R3B96_25050 [Pirellulaceae bacterium]